MAKTKNAEFCRVTRRFSNLPRGENKKRRISSIDATVRKIFPRPTVACSQVALRLSCAAWGARGVAASDRLVGGKRDTAFRAGVAEAVAAVETVQTIKSSRGRGVAAVDAAVTPRWESLGGYPPDVFLSDLARDLGMTPERAGSLVASATARRAENRLLQAGVLDEAVSLMNTAISFLGVSFRASWSSLPLKRRRSRFRR